MRHIVAGVAGVVLVEVVRWLTRLWYRVARCFIADTILARCAGSVARGSRLAAGDERRLQFASALGVPIHSKIIILYRISIHPF